MTTVARIAALEEVVVGPFDSRSTPKRCSKNGFGALGAQADIRPDGSYGKGDAALVRLSVDEVLDPSDSVTVLHRRIFLELDHASQRVARCLRRQWPVEQATHALEKFSEF